MDNKNIFYILWLVESQVAVIVIILMSSFKRMFILNNKIHQRKVDSNVLQAADHILSVAKPESRRIFSAQRVPARTVLASDVL